MDIKTHMEQVRRLQLEQLKNAVPKTTPTMPSLLEMGKNLASTVLDTAKSAINGQGVSLTDDQANSRFEICKQCEFYVGERCSKCGCYMAVKTHLKAATCPVGKW